MAKELTQQQKDSGKFFSYDQLSDKAKKEAHDRFAWDFVNDKWSDKTEEEIMEMLSKHWFDETGGTYLSY